MGWERAKRESWLTSVKEKNGSEEEEKETKRYRRNQHQVLVYLCKCFTTWKAGKLSFHQSFKWKFTRSSSNCFFLIHTYEFFSSLRQISKRPKQPKFLSSHNNQKTWCWRVQRKATRTHSYNCSEPKSCHQGLWRAAGGILQGRHRAVLQR